MLRFCLMLMLLGAKGLSGQSANSTAEVVRKGMSCRQASTGHIECTYTIGQSLVVLIAGVGEDGATIFIDKTEGLKGDYYASISMAHQCVVVKPGEKTVSKKAGLPTFAFIAHRDGKVYPDWTQCRDANLAPPRS